MKNSKKPKFKITSSETRRMSVIKLDLFELGNVINSDTLIDVSGKTSEEIDKIIAEILQEENSHPEHEWLSFRYHINILETLTDNREEIFGHPNQSSSKFMNHETDRIYVRGEVYTLAGFLAKINNGKLSSFARVALYEFISNCGFDKTKLKNEELSIPLIKIECGFPNHVLFEEFQEKYILKT